MPSTRLRQTISRFTRERTKWISNWAPSLVSGQRANWLRQTVWLSILRHMWQGNDSLHRFVDRLATCVFPRQSRRGKNSTNFHFTLKPNVELQHQRATKVALQLKDKLEKPLTELTDVDIVREMGDDDRMGSVIVNPIILMPKIDYVKLMIDARYLSSVTDLINSFWP